MKNGGYKKAYNFPIYSIEKQPAIGFIGHYESMNPDLKTVCENLSIPFDGWLPNAKGDYRINRHHYRDYYHNNHAEMVRNYYEKEIDLLKYVF
ncbi:hypothetical protein [Bacillus pakistanensis]|nr:hypothetical protein [Bacillus pakistanensis]